MNRPTKSDILRGLSREIDRIETARKPSSKQRGRILRFAFKVIAKVPADGVKLLLQSQREAEKLELPKRKRLMLYPRRINQRTRFPK